MTASEKQNGFTLVELIVIVAIIAAVAAFASPSAKIIKTFRMTSEASELSSDLQKLRSDSLTSGTGVDSRGFGIRFEDANSYTLFEFNDCNGNFAFNSDGCSGSTEALGERLIEFPADIYVTKKNTSMPAGEMLLYDKKGMARGEDWGPKKITFVVRHRNDDLKPRCIAVDAVRIREGTWNVNECEDK